MKIRGPLSLSLLATSLLAAPAFAQDPKFEYGKQEELKDVKGVDWDASAEFGLVLTTGNSEVTTLSAGAKASRKAGNNKLALSIDGTYAQSGIRRAKAGAATVNSIDDIETVNTVSAKNVTAKARYDRFLSKLDSVFLAAIARSDEPAGIELGFQGQVGYSRGLYKSEKHELLSEIGYDFTYQKFVTGDPESNSIHSARAFFGYKGKMNEATNVEATLEILPNLNKYTMPTGEVGFFEGTRVNGFLGITSKLTKSLSVNTSLGAKFSNRPAPLSLPGVMFVDGFVLEAAKTDAILKASLIYSFF